MNRWTSILGVLLLVLMLWAGSPARAAERPDCIAPTCQVAVDFDGYQDQAPADPGQSVAHHHFGCSSHQDAGPASFLTVEIATSQKRAPFAWRETGVWGHDPDSLLRPPIA